MDLTLKNEKKHKFLWSQTSLPSYLGFLWRLEIVGIVTIKVAAETAHFLKEVRVDLDVSVIGAVQSDEQAEISAHDLK